MFLTRRLSQRPTAEELEQRNILKRECLKLVCFNIISKLLKSNHNLSRWQKLPSLTENSTRRSLLCMQAPYNAAWWFESPSYVKASGIHLSHFFFFFLFVLGLPFHPRQAGSKVPWGVMSRETGFLAQTHAVSERGSSVAWDSAALTSKTDLPAVPALLEAPAWLAECRRKNTKSKNSWVTSHVTLNAYCSKVKQTLLYFQEWYRLEAKTVSSTIDTVSVKHKHKCRLTAGAFANRSSVPVCLFVYSHLSF